jgi:DNA-binding CsgD family transcriptional regulator
LVTQRGIKTAEEIMQAVLAAGDPELLPWQPRIIPDGERQRPAYRPRLSEREIRVLHLLAWGDQLPEIAAQMGVSYAVARRLSQSLYKKLSAVNAAHAVHLAWQYGILDESSG